MLTWRGTLHRRRARQYRERRENDQGRESPPRQPLERTEAQVTHPTANPTCRCSFDQVASPGVAAPAVENTGIDNNDRRENDEQAVWNRRDRPLNIHDLSFILHPSHEGPSPEKDVTSSVFSHGSPDEEPALIATVCAGLGVNRSFLAKA
jgi:hypothetical protein